MMPDPATAGSHVFYRKLTRRYPRIVRAEGCYLVDDDGPPVPRRVRRRVRGQPRTRSSGDRRRHRRSGTHPGVRERHRLHPRAGGGAGGRAGQACRRATWSWSIRWGAAPRRSRRRSSWRGSTGSRWGGGAKHKIVALAPSYHGNTLLALSASARPHYSDVVRRMAGRGRAGAGALRVPLRVPGARHRYCPACSGDAVEAAHRARRPRHGGGGHRGAGGRLVHRGLCARNRSIGVGSARSATGTTCCWWPTRC